MDIEITLRKSYLTVPGDAGCCSTQDQAEQIMYRPKEFYLLGYKDVKR
jgi:hypothetical protein